MERRHLSRLAIGLLGALVLVAGWLSLGPTQLGGPTSYAVIVGSSMEPLLDRGDLAIVRRAGSYLPGDVVLYESEEVGAKVLHRIESVRGERFVLKGDNNGFVDGERPLESQIVGELWFHVPAVGRVAGWLRQPLHAALIVGLATLLALGGGAGLATRRVGRARTGSRELPVEPQVLVVGAAGALLLCLLLAVVSFARPTTRVEALEEAYVQQGRFEYSATVPANAVYPTGGVMTGEPVFLKLVRQLRVDFAYELQSSLPTTARGRIGLVAHLRDGRGWERRFELASETPFRGRRATVSGTIDLRRIQTLIDRMQALTGSGQAAYSLAIMPSVSVEGRVGEAPLDADFAPLLGFDVADLRLQPELEGSGEGASALTPRDAGAGTHTVTNELSLGVLELSVLTVRLLSLIGLAGSILLGLYADAVLRRRRGDEPARISARYGSLLVAVTSRPQSSLSPTDLADIESLVRLAEHSDQMILHLVDGDEHSYVVEVGGFAYRYRPGAPEQQPTEPLVAVQEPWRLRSPAA